MKAARDEGDSSAQRCDLIGRGDNKSSPTRSAAVEPTSERGGLRGQFGASWYVGYFQRSTVSPRSRMRSARAWMKRWNDGSSRYAPLDTYSSAEAKWKGRR